MVVLAMALLQVQMVVMALEAQAPELVQQLQLRLLPEQMVEEVVLVTQRAPFMLVPQVECTMPIQLILARLV
jgi:hypothetical protein